MHLPMKGLGSLMTISFEVFLRELLSREPWAFDTLALFLNPRKCVMVFGVLKVKITAQEELNHWNL